MFTVKNTFLDFNELLPEPTFRRIRSDSVLLAPRVVEAFGRLCSPAAAPGQDQGPAARRAVLDPDAHPASTQSSAPRRRAKEEPREDQGPAARRAVLDPDAHPASTQSSAPPRRAKEEPRAPPAAEAAAVQVAAAPGALSPELRTTVMLRNLPYQITRAKLVELLEQSGLGGQYDIVYVPMDFNREQSLGYSFVNLVSPEAASMCFKYFDGLDKWQWKCSKVCQVVWSEVQGFEANVDHYRNSPVMHPDIPAPFKPTIYSGGLPVEFPAPTRELKCPRLRRGHRLK